MSENHAPMLTVNDGATVVEGGSTQITGPQLEFTDHEQPATAITYTVTSSTNGAVRVNGAAIGVNGTFTQADIDSGRLTFTHDGSETDSASFDFSVSDGAGGVVPGQRFVLTVAPVNDAPVLQGFGAPVLFDNGGWSETASAADSLSAYAFANDFVLQSAATLSEFSVYLADGVVNDDGVLSTFSGILGWAIYRDDGGRPGTLLRSGTDGDVEIADTGLTWSHARDVFRATVDLPDIDLTAGSYWLALREGSWTAPSFDGSPIYLVQAVATEGALAYAYQGYSSTPTFTRFVRDQTLQIFADVPVVTFGDQTVKAGGQLLAPDVTFTDAEGNLSAAKLTVSGLTASDVVSIRAQGTGPGQIGVAGNIVTFGSLVIGSFAGGSGSDFTVTFNANATNGAIEALIENLTFANTSDTPLPSRVLQLDIADGAGTHLAYPLALEVRIVPNDPPVLVANGGGAVAEGGSTEIADTQLRFGDAEQADTAITYTLTSATNGTVRLNGTALGVNGAFTQDDINNDRITFLHDGSETTTASFGFSVSDGAGGAVAGQSFVLNVAPLNDAPVLDGFGGTAVVLGEQAVNAGGQVLVPDVTFTDAEGNLTGGTLRVSGLASSDIVSIRNQGTGAGQIGVSGSDVTFGNVAIGSFTGGSSGAAFLVTFTAAATNAAVEALIENLTFANTSNTPVLSRVLTLDVADGAGAHLSQLLSREVRITAENDPPVATNNDGATVAEGESIVIAAAQLRFTDPEQQATATAITYTVTSTTNGTVRLNGSALAKNGTFTQSDINNGRVSFLHDGSETTSASFGFAVSDGAGGTVEAQSFALVVTPMNDAPVVTHDQGGAVLEGGSIIITAEQLRFTDAEQTAPAIIYTIASVTNGTVRLNGTALALDGTFTQDDIDSGRVTFVHDGSDTTSASFGFSVSDGFDGIVEAQSFALTVTPVNDAPTLAVIAAPTPIEEDAGQQTIGLAGITAGGSESQPLLITATSDNPDLIGDPTVTYTSADQTGSLHYTPAAGASGSALITVTVTDGGLDGDLATADDNGTVTRQFAVTVNSVKDDPVVAAGLSDRTSAVNQPVDITIPAGAFSDADGDTLTLTAALANGDPLPGSLTFDGTTMTGKPPQNFFGDLEIRITASDGNASVSDTFRLTISNAGNDVLVSGGPGQTGTGEIFPLVGGSGDDVYAVADEDAEVTEQDGGGTDTVYATVTYTMANNVEGMVLQETGGAIDGFGSDGNDTIFGNSLTNWLHGGDGSDALIGGSGSDVLFGDAGIDGMAGGAGDDTYVVDNTFDQILENPGEGTDTVYAGATYILPDNVEGLVLLEGAGAIDGFGCAGNDTIIGNSEDNVLDGRDGSDVLIGGGGNDVLIGGTGIDGMAGGTGDDTYGVDNTFDQIQENAGEGADTVYAGATFTLTANLEALVLVDGAGAIDGTGNGEDNYLFGNSSANTLHGLGGNDVLFGGAGEDTLAGDDGDDVLTGGGDDDLFVFGVGFGRDSIADFTTGDHIVFSPAVFADFAAVQAHMVTIDASTTAIVLDNDNMLAVHHAPGAALTQSDFLFG